MKDQRRNPEAQAPKIPDTVEPMAWLIAIPMVLAALALLYGAAKFIVHLLRLAWQLVS